MPTPPARSHSPLAPLQIFKGMKESFDVPPLMPSTLRRWCTCVQFEDRDIHRPGMHDSEDADMFRYR